jgi:two-component system heavy metal sensor histidine kinase CusS
LSRQGRRSYSLTTRLSATFAAVTVLLLAGVGSVLYAALERQLRDREAAELVGTAELVRHLVGRMRSADEIAANPEPFREFLIGHERLHFILLDAAGRELYSSTRLGANSMPLDQPAPPAARPGPVRDWHGPAGRPYRVLAEEAPLADPAATPLVAVLASDSANDERLLEVFRESLIGTLILGAVLAATGGFLAVRRVLAPLHSIARTAGHITARRLDSRLDPVRAPVELGELVDAFNTMLSRLEDAFGRLSAFSSDLAHEFRTPLNNLIGQAQVALTRARNADEYRTVIESNLEECERLSRLVRDMLFLAQADHGEAALATERFDLRLAVDKVVESYEPLAEERRVRVAVEGAAPVVADRPLLERAIANLLSNALKHTPEGGTVRVRIARESDAATRLDLENPGPGISVAHLPRVFDRFYRVETGRERAGASTGLGLSIVKSIAEMHGGAVEAHSTPGTTTRFTLRLPSTVPVPRPAAPARAAPAETG